MFGLEICCSTGSTGAVRRHRSSRLTFNEPRGAFYELVA